MESLKIKVDVKRRTTENINLQQGYTYPIELTILDNGKEYDCTGAIPQIHFAKSNGTFNIKTKDITIEGNKVSFILDSEATNRSGTGKLQAVLTRNGFTFGSWAIFCNIFENVIQDGATEDKNVIDVLTELKDEVTKAKPLADSLNANIPKAQPLVNSLNTQIPQATEIAREIESIIEEGGAVDKRELGEYKKDFEGVEHDTLNSRLNRDFDNLHQRMNDSSLLAYEGTSIKADNTYLGLTKDTVIKGRTLQNLTIGEIDYILGTSGSGKITKETIGKFAKYTTIENGSSYITCRLTKSLSFIKPNTTYTIIFTILENTIPNYNGITIAGAPDPHYLTSINRMLYDPSFNLNVGTKIVKFTTDSDISGYTGLGFGFPAVSSSVGAGKVFYIGNVILLEGDHTQTPLEELPYIEGIESTGDKSKNLFDGITRNGYYSNGEFKANSSNLANVNPIEIKPNTYYTGSGDAPPRMSFYDKDMNFISYNSNSSTCLSPSNAKYMNIHGMGATYFQIEEGETATPYQEYYDDYKISGKSIGKNLIKNNNYSCTFPTNVHSGQTEFSLIEKNIKVKPNTTYCFTYSELDNPLGHIKLITSENPINSLKRSGAYSERVREIGGHKGTKITTLENENYITLTTGNWDCNTQNYFNVVGLQLEESTSLSEYEPYKESNYSYILNEPLRSLPNGVCDTIDLTTGVLTRRVGKVVLNGSESWGTTGYGGHETRNTFEFLLRKNGEATNYNGAVYGYCDKFPYEFTNSLPVSDGVRVVINGTTEFTNNYILVCPPTSLIPYRDATAWKDYLRNNNVTVYYQLNNETTEQLTPQQIKSFDTTTHVVSDNKIMPIVSTKIPSDVNAVVQGLKTENVKLEKQLDSAIEELNNTDIDLIAMDWETDYRLCELEWTLLDTMKVETLAENKVVENRILSRYEQAKILIESGKYNKTTMEKQLTMYYNRNYLTKEEFNELMQLMNPIGEVETLEELDKVENI